MAPNLINAAKAKVKNYFSGVKQRFRQQGGWGSFIPVSPQSIGSAVKSAGDLSSVTRQLSQTPNKKGILDDVGRVGFGTASKLLNVAQYPLRLSQRGSQNISTGFKEGNPLQVAKGAGEFLGGGASLYYGGKLLGKGGLPGIAGRATVGAGIGLGMGTGTQILTGGGLPTKEQAMEYIQSGVENSWTLAITNALTDKVLGMVAPKLASSVLTQPFKTGQVAQGLKQVFARALAEVPAENTAFTWLDRLDGESQNSFIQDWLLALPGNIISNLAFASVQGTWNTAINKESRSAVNKALKDTLRHWTMPVTTTEIDPKTGLRVKMPMWQYKMRKGKAGLSVQDLSKLTPEEYKKATGKEAPDAEAGMYDINTNFTKELPKGINPNDIKEARIFGSSLRKAGRDNDIALFIEPNHPILKGTDALPGQIEIGNKHYSIFADTPINRSIFEDFAREKFPQGSDAYIWKTIPESSYRPSVAQQPIGDIKTVEPKVEVKNGKIKLRVKPVEETTSLEGLRSTKLELPVRPRATTTSILPSEGIIPQKTYSAVGDESKMLKTRIAAEKQTAIQDFNEWKRALYSQEGATKTPYMHEKGLVEDVGKNIQKNTITGGVNVENMKDISGRRAYMVDVYRNFKKALGTQFDNVKRNILDPFDASKGNLARSYKNWSDRIDNEIVKRLNIKKGSKESAAVQLYGEKQMTADELVSKFGEKKAQNIIEADKWFRKEYDQLLAEVNAVMKKIYPNNPEKIIQRRADYYRHFREISNKLSGILNIFDNPANIKSSLAGTSEYTKPKMKWLSFAQKRLGGETDVDAVGGFIDYVKAAEYTKNIDPHISKFHTFADELSVKTADNPKLNTFIEYIHDFARDLSGKTNPADRFIQKVVGRKSMQAVNWLNNRVKANVILGNASSSLAQIFNVPQGIADAGGVNSLKGLGTTVANIFGDATPIRKSNFITERYGSGVFDKFDRGLISGGRKIAAWMVTVLDEVGTKYIWNSEYAKALTQKLENPIKFADDATRRMVAGRGVGEVPLLQKSKLFQLAAPFQLEVANLWHVMGDWVSEKQFGKIVAFFVLSHLFNKGAKAIRGSDVSFDPIQASIEAYNTYKEEEDKGIGALKAGGRLAGEVLSNVPLGQTAAVMYPEYGMKVGDTQLPTRSDLFGEGDPTRYGSGLLAVKGLQDPLFKVIPTYGGQQIKRTIEGVGVTEKGYSESKTGRVRFPVEDSFWKNLQRAIFGQYSTSEAQEYFGEDRSVLGEKQSETYKKLLETSPEKAKDYYNKIIKSRETKAEKEKEASKKEKEGIVSTVSAAENVGEEPNIITFVKGEDVKEVDLNKQFKEPTDSIGSKDPFDKEAVSRYKSEITGQINDLYDAYEAGAISEEMARELIGKLTVMYSKTKVSGGSKGKLKRKIKYVPLKFGKTKKITGLTKTKAFKLPRAPKIKQVKF